MDQVSHAVWYISNGLDNLWWISRILCHPFVFHLDIYFPDILCYKRIKQRRWILWCVLERNQMTKFPKWMCTTMSLDQLPKLYTLDFSLVSWLATNGRCRLPSFFNLLLHLVQSILTSLTPYDNPVFHSTAHFPKTFTQTKPQMDLGHLPIVDHQCCWSRWLVTSNTHQLAQTLERNEKKYIAAFREHHLSKWNIFVMREASLW